MFAYTKEGKNIYVSKLLDHQGKRIKVINS